MTIDRKEIHDQLSEYLTQEYWQGLTEEFTAEDFRAVDVIGLLDERLAIVENATDQDSDLLPEVNDMREYVDTLIAVLGLDNLRGQTP